MDQLYYDQLCDSVGAMRGMIRPEWHEEEFHKNSYINKNITVLMCQRKTKDITQLALESLLRFYPDIPILVVDGKSQDDSIIYLRYMALLYPNIKVWERDSDVPSHGIAMDEAIRNFIDTKYVLLMDSDVISMRYGYIEGMLEQFKDNPKLFATGTLMLVTYANQACGAPRDDSDVLRYSHPSLSLMDVSIYKQLRPFENHGAPCVFTMMDAAAKGYYVGAYPVDKYTAHLSGASWTEPRTIWPSDLGTFIRPFITFIASLPGQLTELTNQLDHDFDIMTYATLSDSNKILHGPNPNPLRIINKFLNIRFNVTGHYVCFLNEYITKIDDMFVIFCKKAVIEQKAPDELNVGGIRLVKRQVWQLNDALK